MTRPATFQTIATRKDNQVACILGHEAYVDLPSMHINRLAQTSIESRDKIYWKARFSLAVEFADVATVLNMK